MKLNKMITEDCSKAAVLFHSKKRILEYISQVAHSKLPHIPQNVILESLLSREKLGSTGIGRGIAIPHGRLAGLDQTLAIVMTSNEPISFDAIDNRAVDLFVVLLVPEEECKEHLKTLAQIADKLRNKDFCKQLRMAKNDQELYQAIQTHS